MPSNYFFKASWLIQLIVGISLFTVSFLIEKQILEAFITTSSLALLLAAALESGKAVAIIWHRYMSDQSTHLYPLSVRLASNTFRIGLLGLSMVCSLLFLSNNLDRPNLDTTKKADISQIEVKLNQKLTRLDQQKQERLILFKNNLDEEYQRLKKGFDRRIDALQKERRTEMNNVVNGTFKGPRYAEIETRLNRAIQQADSTLTSLIRKNKKAYLAKQQELLKEFDDKREQAFEKADDTQTQIQGSDFANDERANDPRIVSFLKVLQSIFGVVVFPLQFVFIFSLLISLLMEIGILLSFNTITLSILPALKASHKADLSRDILKTKIDQEAKEDEIRHEEAINKIRNTANNVMDKANEYMNVQSIKNH